MKNDKQTIIEINDLFWSLINSNVFIESNFPIVNGDFYSNLNPIKQDIDGIIKHWSESSFYDLRSELVRLTGLCSIASYSKDILQVMFASLSELYHPSYTYQPDITRVLTLSILCHQSFNIPPDFKFTRDEDKILDHLYRSDFTLNADELNGLGLSNYYLSIYNAINNKQYINVNEPIINIAQSWLAEYEACNRKLAFNINHLFPFEWIENSLFCLLKRKGVNLNIPVQFKEYYFLGNYMV